MQIRIRGPAKLNNPVQDVLTVVLKLVLKIYLQINSVELIYDCPVKKTN